MKESEGDWERAAGERKGSIMREGTGETDKKTNVGKDGRGNEWIGKRG